LRIDGPSGPHFRARIQCFQALAAPFSGGRADSQWPVHRPEGQVAEHERVVEVARVATKPEPIDDIEQKGYGFRVAIRDAARGQTQRPLEANRLYADSWVKVHC